MSIQDLMLLTTQLNEEVKKKILVVEDNQINAIVLKRILLNYHFEVIIAEDGQKGALLQGRGDWTGRVALRGRPARGCQVVPAQGGDLRQGQRHGAWFLETVTSTVP